MEEADLTGQHALAESSVARPQNGSAVGGELRRDAQSWRHDIPGVQRSQTGDDLGSFVSLRIDRMQILTDGAAVVEPKSGIDRQSIADRDGVARER